MSIPTRFFGDPTSSSIILFVGGSGDSKDSFTSLITQLVVAFPHYKFITFSFRGVEDHKNLLLSQQIDDLKWVIKSILETDESKITLVATSNGAYSSSHILINPQFHRHIKNIVFLDPADHYINTQITVKEARTWTGLQPYLPSNPTSSTLLQHISSDIKINVVNFTIRNYGVEGYVEMHDRGIDNKNKYTRLNNDMVKSFYQNTPNKNRGLYIEDDTLPHAFMRDGDVEKNIRRITHILQRCLSGN
ncbi:MAG: alpha/beta hydrolase [Candidatus Roizmanbacteria bacterium]|nr:alpha/beta hydrolase [Candidatus Roizmanbacteria bacterium]